MVAVATAGSALAKSHLEKGHHKARGHVSHPRSLVTGFAPHPRAWLTELRHSRHHAKAARRQSRQPEPRHRRRGTTLSIYEQTAKPWILARQGCSAARRHESGV